GVFTPEFQADPVGAYAACRRQHWIARCEFGFVVVRREAVADLLRDPRAVTPGAMVAQMMGAAESPWGQWVSSILLSTDGDAHARLRRLVSGPFSARRADEARPMMRAVLDELLAPLVLRDRFDLMHDVCHEFPIRVLCNLIGVDERDVPSFVGWVDTLGRGYDFDPALVPELDAALVAMRDYVSALVDRRSAELAGADDLVGALIAASVEGDRLSRDELLTMIVLLLGAGADTTKYQIGNLVYGALAHPGQWDRLVADPTSIPAAVEESLRFRAAVGTTARLAATDIDYRGLTIPAGSFLFLAIASAGHDGPSADPERFDAGRADTAHLAFGLGPHFCLGSHIARAELAVTLEVLLDRLRDVRIDGPVTWNTPIGVGGPSSLALRLRP
ncbi:MAG TPA: cytochrome P450, partial [Acidimicrobiia bacterium]|nr:cytochrome P450 [Acidimicrobiia bacterium]